MRGLPAFVRAVPARLFARPRMVQQRQGERRGDKLLDLIGGLPEGIRSQALTHASWAATRAESNERLEFLGDSVLGLVIAAELFRRYPGGDEGELARKKAFVVSRASCGEVAERMGVGRLMASVANEKEGSRGDFNYSRVMVGNALEALIGAVFLTFGFDRARWAVIDAFDLQMSYGASVHVDHKTALQELLASRGVQPEYRLAAQQGPAHARVFVSEVNVGGRVEGRGSGTTIKMSEQEAAKEALGRLGKSTTVA